MERAGSDSELRYNYLIQYQKKIIHKAANLLEYLRIAYDYKILKISKLKNSKKLEFLIVKCYADPSDMKLYTFHVIRFYKTKVLYQREKGSDLIQLKATNSLCIQKMKDKKYHRDATKFSITQRLQADLGRSVRVIIFIKPVWSNLFKWLQPSHSLLNLC